jgi:hypothetical protein
MTLDREVHHRGKANGGCDQVLQRIDRPPSFRLETMSNASNMTPRPAPK